MALYTMTIEGHANSQLNMLSGFQKNYRMIRETYRKQFEEEAEEAFFELLNLCQPCLFSSYFWSSVFFCTSGKAQVLR